MRAPPNHLVTSVNSVSKGEQTSEGRIQRLYRKAVLFTFLRSGPIVIDSESGISAGAIVSLIHAAWTGARLHLSQPGSPRSRRRWKRILLRIERQPRPRDHCGGAVPYSRRRRFASRGRRPGLLSSGQRRSLIAGRHRRGRRWRLVYLRYRE
jgi:hypothetical protein